MAGFCVFFSQCMFACSYRAPGKAIRIFQALIARGMTEWLTVGINPFLTVSWPPSKSAGNASLLRFGEIRSKAFEVFLVRIRNLPRVG